MLRTKNLTFSYTKGVPMSFPDISCAPGEQCLILGQSGCGKTTLLHLLGGLLSPKVGEIQIGDTNIGKLNRSQLDRFRGQHIGIIFQKPHFAKAINVEENLLLAQYLAGQQQDKSKIKSLLEQLNLGHKLQSPTSSLSQGEQQRVAIARALVNNPDVILADEPTSALDDTNTKEVIKLLEQQAEAHNAALLIVTHDARLKEHISKQIHLQPITA